MAQRVDSFMEDERVHRQNMADAINSIESRGVGTISSFTRDTALASGSVSYTGIGFRPQTIIFLANQTTTDEMSIGFDNSTSRLSLGQTSAGVWEVFATFSIVLIETNGVASYKGLITSMDDDGFTISWTREGTPSGTGVVLLMAFR